MQYYGCLARQERQRCGAPGLKLIVFVKYFGCIFVKIAGLSILYICLVCICQAIFLVSLFIHLYRYFPFRSKKFFPKGIFIHIWRIISVA